jgi:2'-5' RNA ligase
MRLVSLEDKLSPGVVAKMVRRKDEDVSYECIGKDGDHIDVIIGPHPESQLVHIVNQNDHKGRFDEHKVVLGCTSKAEAHEIYHDNYEDGWKGCGSISQMTIGQFKEWLGRGKRTRVAPIEKALGEVDEDSGQTEPPPHKCASTQVQIPDDLADRIHEWGESWIHNDDLADDGRETDIHITVKYGLTEDGPMAQDALRRLCASQASVQATLGEVGRFDTNDDFDVLYVSVTSPDLERLNDEINRAIECVTTHPTYTPHLTLAYVKKGACADLPGSEPFAGQVVDFDSLMLSTRDRNKEAIPFGVAIEKSVGCRYLLSDGTVEHF